MEKVIYDSPFGPVLIMAYNGRIVYCNWSTPDCLPKLEKLETCLKNINEVKKLIGKEPVSSAKDKDILEIAIKQLNEYFNRDREYFDLPLDLIGTDFQKKVWTNLMKIKYGSVSTYKELAGMCGNFNSVRAVAAGCGANPIAVIIPCHRIIASNGKLGGYTGGLDKKLNLLKHESNKIFG